ncbi:MAG: prepilin-type N-terminal cleavage/methylation domain-containing protein [Halopseudomonas yangmingensis]|uniref:General secretion pathway protein H n=1 Tax=Halopseudomonas yangmingensis TaxID=1720063 RepID=A0A1I4U725_9GAMM|nr:prepilin-type N-terminal cleavage/methylation domain-containing protein [Halopseudomonas yangmingensis]SFM84650.1 general secretion pathway protein H [Halopseudomonas yangmingensis]
MGIASRRAGNRSRGFTLIELLVVLVLVGIVAGLAVLAIGDPAERQLQREIERLQTVLELARDEAMIAGGSERALGLRADGYSLLELRVLDDRRREWAAVNDRLLGQRELDASLFEISLEQGGRRIPLSLAGSWEPHVGIGDTGEMTPALIGLKLRTRGAQQRFLQIAFEGRLEVLHERP